MKYLITLSLSALILTSCGTADITGVQDESYSSSYPPASSAAPSSSSVYTPPPLPSSSSYTPPSTSQFTRYFSTKEYYYDVQYPVLECDASHISITANVGNTNTLVMNGSEYCSTGAYDNTSSIINLTTMTEAGVTENGMSYKLLRGYEVSSGEYIYVQWFGEYGAAGEFRFWYENCYVNGLDLCDEYGNHMMFHFRE